jgi:predicted GTPase
MAQRVLIMGAAGRDFHNFNVYFRDNPDYEVVAFTATQIPYIEKPALSHGTGRRALSYRHPDSGRERAGAADR